jgi:hypothetical protein
LNAYTLQGRDGLDLADVKAFNAIAGIGEVIGLSGIARRRHLVSCDRPQDRTQRGCLAGWPLSAQRVPDRHELELRRRPEAVASLWIISVGASRL